MKTSSHRPLFTPVRFFLAAIAVAGLAPQANAYISASPGFVNFFDTPVGGFGGTQSVTVRNNSNEVVQGLNVYDNCFGDFRVSNYGCYGQLQPFGSCNLSVQFQPSREGLHSCSVRISATGSSESVSLQGRGTRNEAYDNVSGETVDIWNEVLPEDK